MEIQTHTSDTYVRRILCRQGIFRLKHGNNVEEKHLEQILLYG